MNIAAIINGLADGVLREQALAAIARIDSHIADAKHKFGRTQIRALQDLAHQHPEQVFNYANHQRKKLPESATAFPIWLEIEHCCQRPNDNIWSIQKEARRFYDPAWLALDVPILAGATEDERKRQNTLRVQRRVFVQEWTAAVTPVFFDFFCTEYSYRLSQIA